MADPAQEAEDARLGRRVSTERSPTPTENIILVGRYVTLTGLKESDMPSLWHHLQLPGNTALLAFVALEATVQTPEELWHQLEEARKKGLVVYAVKADPTRLRPSTAHARDSEPWEHTETVGTLAYLDVQPVNRALEIGAVLFSPLMQRTVASTECQYLLLRHAFSTLSPPYRRAVWKCNALNTASKRAAERLGFMYEGTFRNHLIVKGRSRDSWWGSILDDEWPGVKGGLEGWLDESNFDSDGMQQKRLEDVRREVIESSKAAN